MARTRRAGLGIVVLAILAAPAAAAAAEAGMVAAVRGQARVERGAERLEARIGLAVQTGDVLVTAKKARLKVLLSDDSVLALGGDSRVQISEHLFQPASQQRITRLELLGGSLRALVIHLVGGRPADFQVKARTAVAGVRGTEFAVLEEPAGTRLVTFSGRVAWSVPGAEAVMVAAGQGSRIAADRPTRPEALATAELSAARRATDVTQQPSALAWNLTPRAADRLAGGPGRPAPGGDDERDAGGSQGEAGDRHPGGLDDRGGQTAGDSFLGGATSLDDGEWNNGTPLPGAWDQDAGGDPTAGRYQVPVIVHLVDRIR